MPTIRHIGFLYCKEGLLNAEYIFFQGCVQYGTYRGIPPVYTAGITGPGHFGKFGTASIPVPETSVSSVRHPYRYREYRYRTEHTLIFFGRSPRRPGRTDLARFFRMTLVCKSAGISCLHQPTCRLTKVSWLAIWPTCRLKSVSWLFGRLAD